MYNENNTNSDQQGDINKLRGLRCYLSGPMEFSADGGEGWRRHITPELLKMGIIVLDPYHKTNINISQSGRQELIKQCRRERDWDAITELAKPMRNYDLRMVDACDVLIAYINPWIQTCGTWEEIFWANRMKKPILLVWEGGKEKISSWMFAVTSHENFFSNFTDLIARLRAIDRGHYLMDKRWIIL
jgi:hypothetical protein